MTVSGIWMDPNVLAVEALNLLKNNHITTLLVSDKNRHLLGIIHTYS
nr:hypothetical protein [Candidatus Schneideria nysicola]